MKTVHKKVLLIIPSKIVARGIEAVLSELGEFRVEGILSDLSHASEARLRNMDADVIIIDPLVFDYVSRANVRTRLAEHSNAAVVALKTVPLEDEQIRQFDGTISMYDNPCRNSFHPFHDYERYSFRRPDCRTEHRYPLRLPRF